MVQAKFILELLMRLLACPAGLNCAYQRPARRIGRMIGEVIFALALERAAHTGHAACPGRGCSCDTKLPSATHTRTEANCALSMPLVPQRHQQRRRALEPNMSIICTTDTLGVEGWGYLAGLPALILTATCALKAAQASNPSRYTQVRSGDFAQGGRN